MAADLHIHVKTPEVTDEVLRVFFKDTLGSKYFVPLDYPSELSWTEAYDIVANSPSVWVGSVSWLKAALFEDETTFIPDPVVQVHELIGEDLPVLDQELYDKLLLALQRPNQTNYSVDDGSEVAKFLREHLGQQLFTVSW